MNLPLLLQVIVFVFLEVRQGQNPKSNLEKYKSDFQKGSLHSRGNVISRTAGDGASVGSLLGYKGKEEALR